jgi:hypothetical protein
MQTPGHYHRQPSLSIEDLRDSGARAKQGHQIGARNPTLLHEIFQRRDWIRGLDRVVPGFVRFDERGEDIELVTFGGVRLGVHEAIDLLECRLVVRFGSNRLELHHTVST